MAKKSLKSSMKEAACDGLITESALRGLMVGFAQEASDALAKKLRAAVKNPALSIEDLRKLLQKWAK